MSIATSRQEHAEAAERLKAVPTDALERDLQHWTVTAFDTSDLFDEATERLQTLRDLHAEEQAWIRLHVDELRRRRDQARGEEAGS